jgi:RHS repeat-associated protein
LLAVCDVEHFRSFSKTSKQVPSSGRPNKLTDDQATPLDWVKDVLYNTTGQMTQMKYSQNGSASWYTETREYNVLGQLTHITVPTVRDFTYTYSATQNDGRITQMTDAISGETVQYQYDSLKRLTSAATVGEQWGQSFEYDGFGNLLSQIPTKGQTPPLYVNVQATTNRITSTGYSYDSNGNLTAMPGVAMTYDVENRMVSVTRSGVGIEQYVYNPRGERVWQRLYKTGWSEWQERVFFWGAEGNHLLTLSGISTYKNVYFGGRQVYRSYIGSSGTVIQDRLGSTVKHFPFGDEPSATTPNREKFATYYRDEVTALDYARNRYYSSTIARFTTADPYGPSARPGAPQTWNRYTYVGGDPVNRNDPSGLQTVVITDEGPPPITRYYWGWFDEMLLNYVLQYSGWWWNAWNDWAASAGEGNVAVVPWEQSAFSNGQRSAEAALQDSQCASLFAPGAAMMSALGVATPSQLLALYVSQGFLTYGTTYIPNGGGDPVAFSSRGEDAATNLGGVTSYASARYFNSSTNVYVSVNTIALNTDSFVFTGNIMTNGAPMPVAQASEIGFGGFGQAQIMGSAIIHELLHAVGAIPSDGENPAQSEANSGTVRRNCY